MNPCTRHLSKFGQWTHRTQLSTEQRRVIHIDEEIVLVILYHELMEMQHTSHT